MQWSWLPRTRRRAVEDGRLEQWEPTARLIAKTSWVLLGCGLVAILIGVLELS